MLQCSRKDWSKAEELINQQMLFHSDKNTDPGSQCIISVVPRGDVSITWLLLEES